MRLAFVVRARRWPRLAIAALIVPGALVAPSLSGAIAATGTTLFVQQFNNNTVNSAYPVSIPSLPSGGASTNSACLTVSGTTGSGLISCTSSNDAQGSGVLRLTNTGGSEEGGVFAAASVPTSQGIDATFNAYQYGGNGADGIAFVLAAVNPANPLAPTTIGQSGGALGYSAASSEVGLADGYMGIGLDVFGNYSNSVYEGSGCTNPAYIVSNKQLPGQVVVRGPGNGLVGYCAVSSTATSKSSPALTLRSTTRALSVVPMEVAINPTSASFTTASGIVVAAGTYDVRFTPVGGSATTETGTLPVVPSGLYPSSTWTTSAGIPKQLAFGWVGSTGGSNDFHEVNAVNVVSFSAVPQLAVSQTSYVVASPTTGTPVTYTVSPSVSSSGAAESSPVSVTETLPAGVVPAGAYGTGWTCAAPSGQTITCTDSATPFAAGTALPAITVQGIVTSSSVTASTIQSGTTVTGSSSGGNPGIATSTTAGTLPTAPAGVTLTPATGTISGGNAVTISGTNITGATAIEIGTTAQQQAGTSTVLLPCPSGAAPGCFTVSGSTLVISSMPSVAASETATVTVVTLGAYGAPSYAYTDKPGTPAAPTATAGITSATVTWTAPAANNSPITGYVITPYLNGTAQTAQTFSSTATSQTLTGLTAGGSYTFTVAAINAIGTGAASPQSTAVIPYTLPGAPTIGAVSAGDSAASVSWTAPASNGGSAITGYVVTPYIGSTAQTAQTFSGTATTHTVTGLTVGTSYTFTVAAVNAAGTGPASAKSAAVTINAGPALTFAAPPAGEVSIAYSDQLTATGGTGALTWSVGSGSLPPGLTLNAATGLLSGTPTAGGSYVFTVTVTDTVGGIANQAVTLVIAAVPSLSNPAPPAGQAGVAYSDPLAVTGGTGPFTWAVTGGSLPAGLTLNASTGALSGTPTTVGLSSFTVRVTDSYGLTATQGLSVTVAVGQLVIAASASPSTAVQGGVVHYTIGITNFGSSTYSGVSYTASLANVLDDAAYSGGVAATAGTASVSGATLTWSGTLAAGAVATVTFSVTVINPDTGNDTMAFTVVSPTTGTNCPAGGTDARCTASVPVSALTIAASSGVTSAAPGAVVNFTVMVTNSGAVAYTGATFTDPLTGMLDDAAYDSDAAASTGTVSFASPNLTWTGTLAAGASATVTFSVTVNSPDTGNKILTSTITSATAGSNCPAGGTDPRCTATVNVQGLTITASANGSSTTPGAVVAYTVTVTNSGQARYTGATFSDSLSGVLDDAAYNADATASAGNVTYVSPNVTWTGNLAAGASVTITFSVTVRNPDAGDRVLVTAITSATPASNCPAAGPAAACGTSVPVLVPGLVIVDSAGTASVSPGAAVGFTVTITDTGQTAYTGITVTDSLAGALDDGVYNGDAHATSGSVAYASPNLAWTGSLTVGASVTVTFSVTVNSTVTGDKTVATVVATAAAGSNCPAGSTDARCSSSVPVLVPGLDLTVTAGTASGAPGSTVGFTVTADNTGQTTDTGVSFAASLAGVLDDGAYNSDAHASTGTVTYASPVLTWTGTLAAGAIATITFSVTVNNPDAGDHLLAVTLTSAATGNNCPAGGTDPSCAISVPVASLAISNTASPASATPGSVVRFTATFTNTGQVRYDDITISMDAAGLGDDAVPNGDQTASSGALSVVGSAVVWTGDIPVGGTVTFTGSATVNNPDTGNQLVTLAITTAAAGSNCPAGGTLAAACTASVPVLTPGLTITNTPSTTVPVPGSVVGYTVTITNTGQTPYTGVTVTDDLTGVLGDAVYSGGAAVTAGAVSYTSPALTWTGSLIPGAVATVTFSVTVDNPDTGGKTLTAVVTSAAAGSSCPPGTTAAPCRSTVVVLTPGLDVAATAGSATTVPGATVGYTVTITNIGQIPYSGITVTDDLTGVLDDATYTGAATVTGGGSVSLAGSALTWTGSLAVGATATVTFSVTVKNPDTGNNILTTVLTSAAVANTCAAGSTDPGCATRVPVAALAISNTSNVVSTTPGSVVRFTATFTNTGQVRYDDVTLSTNAVNVFDDAVPNGDQTATTGTLTLVGNGLTWTGDIPIGGVITITGTVTVNNPDTGNHALASTITTAVAGSNCPVAAPAAACSINVPVLTPGLTMANTPSTVTTVPGAVLGHTLTIRNSGQAAYTGVTVSESFIGMTGDAVYNNDAVASAGTLSYASLVLTWTGDLAAGASATVTFSVTMSNPAIGDKFVVVTATSAAAGSACPPGTTAAPCRSTVAVLTPGLDIVATTGATAAVPGDTVGYTVTITNTGQTPYTGISVTDDLTGLLDDAAYNDDALVTAGTGTVSYTSPALTWAGSLAPGAAVTVTFSATVNNPDAGNKTMTTLFTSALAGNNCMAGSTDPACATSVSVGETALLTFALTSDAVSTVAGGVVHYTVTVTNAAATAYSGATFTDDLTGLQDDAAYGGDAAVTVGPGTVSYASPDVTWTGTLPAHGTATITYSVTVNSPDAGDKILTSTLTSASAGSNCPALSTDARCSSTVTVSSLVISNTSGVASTTPGSVVRFTATFTNTGQTYYDGITLSTNAAGVFDDAVPNGDQTASSGTLALVGNGLTWTGDIPVGGVITITGTVTVSNPDTGNHLMASTITTAAAGSNCPVAAPAAACSISVPVLTPGLSITNIPSTTATTPGSVVGYTVTITNSGQTPYAGTTVTDDLSGVLGDAAYNGDATPTAGAVTYASSPPVLTWAGDLIPGAVATVTFTVTVHNPDTGGKVLAAVAASAATGSSCPPGTTAAPCGSIVVVLTPALDISTTASSPTTVPGATVAYTVTITNTGQTPYAGAVVTDDLSGVLDDAAYNNDVVVSVGPGTASVASSVLTWTGSLTPGATATVTFSVTVSKPDNGNNILATLLTSAAAGNTCAAGSTDPGCATSVPVASLLITNTASPASATPGGVVRFTATFTNTGQVRYDDITISMDAAGLGDDAVPNGDQTASSGALSVVGSAVVWTGDIPVGGTVTFTGSATVNNPDTGNQLVTLAITTAAAGSNCPAGGTLAAACTASVPVLTPGLTITNTPSTTVPVPGSVVGYTVTITNTGQTPYTGVTVTDDLTGVLGDAVYNSDVAVTAGAVSYTSPALTWTGSLIPGAVATVTFSVTVDNPDTGGKTLTAVVTSAAAGSSCPPGTTAAPCYSTVVVLTPGLDVSTTAGVATAIPGATVHYTVTITDTGQIPYTGISVTDDLTGVVDDATYNGVATVGGTGTATVSYDSPPDLIWTGSLAPGDSSTVTFSVTVNNPDTGDNLLTTVLTSAAAGNTCAAGNTDPGCVTSVAVAAVSMTNTASVSTATPGSVVGYTVTVTNIGQVPLNDIVFTVPLSGVLDDASYDNDAGATNGRVSYASPVLSYDGDLDPGQSATITFSVTVNSPDTGDKTLTSTLTSTVPGATCPASGTAPAACTSTVTVLIPALTITKTANVATTTPGSVVQYTISVADTGPTPYAGAVVTDDLSGVLDDMTYNGNAATTGTGSVSYASPVLTWTGSLSPGGTAIITYTVTVNNPDTGDEHPSNTAVSDDPGSTCPSADPAPACTAAVTVLIPALTLTKTASTATTTPGSVVSYTITVADTGPTPYAGAAVTDDLTSVLDDAAYDGDAAATATGTGSGSVSYASPVLAWTGDLAPGDTATITYSVTVKNPETGNMIMTNSVTSAAPGSTCTAGSRRRACSVTVAIISGPLTMTAPSSADLGAAPPGGTISSSLGTVQVTDGRGFGADWTATVASTAFTTGSGSPVETLPAGNATYTIPSPLTATGQADFTNASPVNLSGNPQAVVSALSVQGNTTATWNPQITIPIPSGAIGGTYTATITHSVS